MTTGWDTELPCKAISRIGRSYYARDIKGKEEVKGRNRDGVGVGIEDGREDLVFTIAEVLIFWATINARIGGAAVEHANV